MCGTFFMLIDILPWSVSSLLNNILKGAWSQFHHKMKNIETKKRKRMQRYSPFLISKQVDKQARSFVLAVNNVPKRTTDILEKRAVM